MTTSVSVWTGLPSKCWDICTVFKAGCQDSWALAWTPVLVSRGLRFTLFLVHRLHFSLLFFSPSLFCCVQLQCRQWCAKLCQQLPEQSDGTRTVWLRRLRCMLNLWLHVVKFSGDPCRKAVVFIWGQALLILTMHPPVDVSDITEHHLSEPQLSEQAIPMCMYFCSTCALYLVPKTCKKRATNALIWLFCSSIQNRISKHLLTDICPELRV